MGIQAPAAVKYAIIREAIQKTDNLLKVSAMCQIAGVSRSGYYRWERAENTRLQREEADKADFDTILTAFRHRGYAKGARGIYMRLLHMGIRMNLKKIRRLMKKFGLHCPYRRPNPYRQMMRNIQTSHVAPNIVNREFRLHGARKILLTDITYLMYRGGKCYLSTIYDAYTREILAYRVSDSLQVDFVIDTVNALIAQHGCSLDDEVIVHSDQGAHYTSHAFINKLGDAQFVQSMSLRGNCWDNAPQESFFGHMKDEIAFEIAKCNVIDAVRLRVDDWIDYYNHDRCQWDLLKLTPTEFFLYDQSGYYPLPSYPIP